jgi:hypothetical protein
MRYPFLALAAAAALAACSGESPAAPPVSSPDISGVYEAPAGYSQEIYSGGLRTTTHVWHLELRDGTFLAEELSTDDRGTFVEQLESGTYTVNGRTVLFTEDHWYNRAGADPQANPTPQAVKPATNRFRLEAWGEVLYLAIDDCRIGMYCVSILSQDYHRVTGLVANREVVG